MQNVRHACNFDRLSFINSSLIPVIKIQSFLPHTFQVSGIIIWFIYLYVEKKQTHSRYLTVYVSTFKPFSVKKRDVEEEEKSCCSKKTKKSIICPLQMSLLLSLALILSLICIQIKECITLYALAADQACLAK